MGRVGTKSVRVDLELWEDAKTKAKYEGLTMQGLITVLLRKYLRKKGR